MSLSFIIPPRNPDRYNQNHLTIIKHCPHKYRPNISLRTSKGQNSTSTLICLPSVNDTCLRLASELQSNMSDTNRRHSATILCCYDASKTAKSGLKLITYIISRMCDISGMEIAFN